MRSNENAVNSIATMAIRYARAGMPCDVFATDARMENGAIGTMKIMPNTTRSNTESVRLTVTGPPAPVLFGAGVPCDFVAAVM